MRDELERVGLPDETAAGERAWFVAREAFAERDPVPRPSHWPRVAAVALVLAALAAAALSPSGRAVLDEIREVVGVERAQPALFSLPAEGRLLVAADSGVWVVQADGSKRLLGDYREASWSPFGRFVVAAAENELVALEPNGDVRWTLARPGVSSPRWAGTEANTRIAYVDNSGLRIVAGDGTGDRLVVPGFRGPLAWRPGNRFVLSYATPRELRTVDVETGKALWRAPVRGVTALDWSANGRRLVAMSRRALRVYDADSTVPLDIGPGAAPFLDAALAPDGAAVTYGQAVSGTSQVWTVPRIRPDANAARRLFSGVGDFDDIAWSPDGEWILVTWPAADQWLFLRANGRSIRAVSNVSDQFRSRTFPRVEGWCCAP